MQHMQMQQQFQQMSPEQEHKTQRQQQEVFIKSNLDYENRLRSHMYQFDDGSNDMAQSNS